MVYSSASQPLSANVAEVRPVPIGAVSEPTVDQNSQPENMELDEDMSLAERRPRRQNRQLPKRFRDILPEPLSRQPTASAMPADLPSNPSPSPNGSNSSDGSFATRVSRMLRTPRNVFGLFRRYCSEHPPSHDPEENIDLSDLSDYAAGANGALPPQHSETNLYPFPNKSSFLLGEWYWNHGSQKSSKGFSELLNIVGNPDFLPEDVRHAKWAKIDTALAKADFDNEDAEWINEDAGWKRTPIHISVPFHHRMKNPGPKEYLVGELYHRSFVSVIREKLANPHHHQNFHYEPFELFWKPTDDTVETRVHGELYTSPAFLEAHHDLQNSPGEPGCDLPRVIVAMMFWSDSTQLTSFGEAKLWPCYLYFGNDSKYHRCKPTCHLSNHVAYFQVVSLNFYVSAKRGHV